MGISEEGYNEIPTFDDPLRNLDIHIWTQMVQVTRGHLFWPQRFEVHQGLCPWIPHPLVQENQQGTV